LGRLLGKALYTGMLVELPFAPFFLSKLLGQQSFLNDLASLDPDLHRNLLFLKTYEGVSFHLLLCIAVQTTTAVFAEGSLCLFVGWWNVVAKMCRIAPT
jgi:hypothetical protein